MGPKPLTPGAARAFVCCLLAALFRCYGCAFPLCCPVHHPASTTYRHALFCLDDVPTRLERAVLGESSLRGSGRGHARPDGRQSKVPHETTLCGPKQCVHLCTIFFPLRGKERTAINFDGTAQDRPATQDNTRRKSWNAGISTVSRCENLVWVCSIQTSLPNLYLSPATTFARIPLTSDRVGCLSSWR